MSDLTPPPSPSQPASQPASAPAYGYPPNNEPRFNVLAIVGFILAFVFSLAGLVVSAISLSQIKKTGERGRPLALWGLILSIAFLAISVISVIVLVAAAASLNNNTY